MNRYVLTFVFAFAFWCGMKSDFYNVSVAGNLHRNTSEKNTDLYYSDSRFDQFGGVSPMASPPATGMNRIIYKMVTFQQLPSKNEIESLAQQGVRLLYYISDNAYWAAIETAPGGVTALSHIPSNVGLSWSTSASQINTLAPEVHSGSPPSYAQLENGWVIVIASVFPGVNEEIVKSEIIAAGGVLLGRPYPNVYRISIHQSKLLTLSTINAIEWIEWDNPPNHTANVDAAILIESDMIQTSPYHLNGEGVHIGIWDQALVAPHIDFDGRLFHGDDGDYGKHPTQVAGTIGGAGIVNSRALGMAPNVTLHSYNWSNDIAQMRYGFENGIRISNHSYGLRIGWAKNPGTGDWKYWHNSSLFGEYRSKTREIDDVVSQTGLLSFWAAGNDRNDGPDWGTGGPQKDGPYACLSSHAAAKNILAIGAVNKNGEMTTFSSWGPTKDGRIKPDLVAVGVGVVSTITNNQYASLTGTSIATPSASGAAAQLYQLYKLETGNDPAPETMKALMIHGARNLGRPGPDYEYGWGLINVRRSADLLLAHQWREGIVTSEHDTVEYSLDVQQSVPMLKATLVWTDAIGAMRASKALVNDLDLLLISPSGAAYQPWVLDPNRPDQNATRGRNSVDNVEQVVVVNPEEGTWKAQVIGFELPTGSSMFTLVSEHLSGLDEPTMDKPTQQKSTSHIPNWEMYN